MFYKWSNEKYLDELQVTSSETVITFTSPIEEAKVYLNDDGIDFVIHKSEGVETRIDSKDSKHVVVGNGNAERDVFHYLKPNGPAPQMRLGITKHRGIGTWSSLPHDFELHTEPGFEEVFFYMINGGNKRAIQVGEGVWFDNQPVKKCWFVEDKTFATVPMGYHPVVSEPASTVNYIWLYLCKKPSWEKI